MDPLSITASALGLAAHVLKTAVLVKEAIGQLRDAPDTATDIEHDITITQAALRQVEAALGHDPQAIRRFGLNDVFDVSVKGCLESLQRIDEEFKSFFGRDDWHARLGIWWNGGELRRLVGRLEAKKGSLMLLVQALSLRSVQEMQVLLQQNRATLDIARLGLEAMVPSYPSYKDKDFDTVASEIASDDSVLGDRDSVISDTRFPFDEICFGSKAYQRAVARVSSKTVKTEVSMPARDTHLASVAEADAETESQASGETAAAAAPAAPAAVESAIHEAVCLKLQEAEARIQALEERIRQGAAKKGRNGPRDRLKDESLRKRVSFNETVREGSSASRPMDINDNDYEHETEEKPEQIASHRAKKDRRHRSGAQRDDGEYKRIRDGLDACLRPTTKNKTDESVPDLNESAKRVLLEGASVKKSQTSLLLEYFENGPGTANGDVRRPSVRVRVTPTPKRQTGSCDKGLTATQRRPLHSDNDCKPSEISAIPPDSFFDESAPSTGRSRRDFYQVDDTNRDRIATGGGIKYKKPKERRTKSRTSSLTENAPREGRARTSRARLAVLADGDVPSGEAHTSRPRYSATSAINNPRLLETVEDAIRRLILPELMAAKREQKEKTQLKTSKLEVTMGEVEQDTAKYADQLPDSRDYISGVPVKAL